MYSRVAMLYSYTLDYLLDHMTMEHIIMLYEYAMEWNGADIEKYDPKPDKAEFYKHYGDKIKRPEGVT